MHKNSHFAVMFACSNHLFAIMQILHSKLEKLDAMVPTSRIQSVILYEGSITVFDPRLHGYDIGTCLEVPPICQLLFHFRWLFPLSRDYCGIFFLCGDSVCVCVCVCVL